MNGLWTIALGAGARDGLNPCIFMTCAFFMAQRFWLKKKTFAWVYALGTLIFNFSVLQIFVFQKNFVVAAKIIYVVLGMVVFVLGILALRDWFLLTRGLPVKDQNDTPLKSLLGNGWGIYLTTIIVGVALSALATVWPINNYVMLLGNTAFLKGQWHSVLPLVLGYVVISMWPLWAVWSFLSIKNLRPSFFKIICASIFFTAASCIVLIFK